MPTATHQDAPPQCPMRQLPEQTRTPVPAGSTISPCGDPPPLPTPHYPSRDADVQGNRIPWLQHHEMTFHSPILQIKPVGRTGVRFNADSPPWGWRGVDYYMRELLGVTLDDGLQTAG
jgi:hypothetical protein